MNKSISAFLALFFLPAVAHAETVAFRCARIHSLRSMEIMVLELIREDGGKFRVEWTYAADVPDPVFTYQHTTVAKDLACRSSSEDSRILLCENTLEDAHKNNERSNSYIATETIEHKFLNGEGKPGMERELRVSVVSPVTTDSARNGSRILTGYGLFVNFDQSECSSSL